MSRESPPSEAPDRRAFARGLETRVRLALERRKNDLIAEGSNFTRHKAAFVGPAEFMVLLKRWYRLGYEDAAQ